jgi:hypothetical protein
MVFQFFICKSCQTYFKNRAKNVEAGLKYFEDDNYDIFKIPKCQVVAIAEKISVTYERPTKSLSLYYGNFLCSAKLAR